VAAIYVAAQVLFSLGWLNHVTASLVLILGFVVECLVVVKAALRPLLVRAIPPSPTSGADATAQNGQGERANATAKM
jgi:hypothetical protein